MHTFEIRERFLLDGKPFTILSGAIHYFRVHPTDWHHSLYNLKAIRAIREALERVGLKQG